VGEILRSIYPDGLLSRDDMPAAAERIVALVRQPKPVPDKDFFPLRNMLAQTLELYEQLAYTPPL